MYIAQAAVTVLGPRWKMTKDIYGTTCQVPQ